MIVGDVTDIGGIPHAHDPISQCPSKKPIDIAGGDAHGNRQVENSHMVNACLVLCRKFAKIMGLERTSSLNDHDGYAVHAAWHRPSIRTLLDVNVNPYSGAIAHHPDTDRSHTRQCQHLRFVPFQDLCCCCNRLISRIICRLCHKPTCMKQQCQSAGREARYGESNNSLHDSFLLCLTVYSTLMGRD